MATFHILTRRFLSSSQNLRGYYLSHWWTTYGCRDWKQCLLRRVCCTESKKMGGDCEELTSIAKNEPEAVYWCYTKAIAHRWTYVQRTIPGISQLFLPLEEAISEKLIPAITGCKILSILSKIQTINLKLLVISSKTSAQ